MSTYLKKMLSLLLAVVFSAGVAMAADPVPFEIFENFDDESHFSAGGIVPDGWVSTGTYDYSRPYRSKAMDCGFLAQSGDYILYSMDQMGSMRDEYLYTPMMKLAGGKEATLSFFIQAPGGTPAAAFYSYVEVKAGTSQTPDGQTIALGSTSTAYGSWTEVKFAFTPEADGEYCFSIAMKQATELSRDHGGIAIDDVTITGYEPAGGATPPAGGDPIAFEVFENFDDASHFSAGGIVPDGWVSTGSFDYSRPYRSVALDCGVFAHSGDYILFSMDQMGSVRDEYLYTPMMKLAGGKEATLSFFIQAPGGTPAAFYSYVEVKAGTSQTPEGQTIALGSTSTAYGSWTEVKFVFTPEADGEYCFSIAMKQSTDLSRDHGSIAIDDITITGWAPKAAAEPATVTLSESSLEFGEVFVGDAYTKTINVKAANLVSDITIENITSEALTTSVATIPMADAMSETGYDLVVTVVPTAAESTASFDLATENMEKVTVVANWTSREYPTMVIAPEETTLDVALLGREYEVVVNVKAANLVSDITIANISSGDYKNDIVPAVDVIPMADAMSEAGYDLVLKVKPSILGGAAGIFELNTTDVKEPAYVSVKWNATTGMELLEPNSENYTNAVEAPYFNTFDNYDNDYDGTTVVPAGWTTVGSSPFFTAKANILEAVTGEFYLVADESELDNRDDRLYTPFFRLSPDYEYTISYYLYMPGNSGGGILRATDLQVTVGTEQDFDFHPVTLQTIEDTSIDGWVKQEFKFRPQKSGAYCFAYTLKTDVNYSGIVAIEDFNITAPGLVARPTANFAVGGLYNVIDSKMLTFENQKVTLVNQSQNGDSYEWEVTYPNGEMKTSDVESPEFEFNESGDYTIELTVTNTRASRSTSKTISVDYMDYESESFTAMTWNPNQDALYERGLIPSFGGDGNEEHEYDFVSGYNRYYHKFAERFELPEGTKLNIHSLNTWLAHYKNCAFTSGYDSEKPFDVVFYGETDGKLDENKVFARLSSTLKDVFGNTGIGSGAGEGRMIDFIQQLGDVVKVEGTFYLAFEFADNMVISAYDPYIGRSYFATNVTKHSTGISTLYVKPTAVPENASVEADGNWYPIEKLDRTKQGLGVYFILWIDNKNAAVNSIGEVVFAVRLIDNKLIVSGTQEGEQVCIYSTNGMLITSAVGQQDSTIIPVDDLANGTYIVKTNVGVQKFVK